MEGSRARALARAGMVLAGVSLLAVLLVAVRAAPPADLEAAGLGWLSMAVLLALTTVASGTALASLVAGLRGGSPAALLGAGAAAAVAGGSIGLLAGAEAFTSALPVGAVLLAGSAVTHRLDVRVDGSARIVVAAAALVLAEAGAVAAVLPGGAELLRPAATALLGAAGVLALIGPVGAGRLVPPGVLASLASAAFLADRGGGLELLIGAGALVAACVAGLAVLADGLDRDAPEQEPTGLPPLAAHLDDAVLQFDGQLQLVDWNRPATSLLGLDATSTGARLEDLIGVSITQLPAEDGPAAVVSGAGGLQIGLHRAGAGVTAIVHDGGTDRDHDDDADRLARELRGTLEELLRARRTIELQRDELERSATVDLLTGVNSRSAIIDRLRTEIALARRYQHPIAIVLLDVDGFADINRRHGVAGGDALLREVALRLRLRVREADALGRAGSDGFLAILPHTDEQGAATFAAALRQRIAQRPILLDEQLMTVTASAGVAVMRSAEDLDLDGLLGRAIEALDSARTAGGDGIALDRDHGPARLDERRVGEGPGAPRAQDSGR
jgi:diguanylate cyclase (GGDEF)-like protein